MKTMMKTALLASGLMWIAGTGTAFAEYPERSLTMIVAYSAGGGTDVAARTVVPYIEKYLGGSITVLNKPGAGGEIGFTELAKSRPDGYTIGFINVPNMLSMPIERQTRYAMEDIKPLGQIVYDPVSLSVRTDHEIQSLDELIALAKAKPGTITYGTTGIGSDDHLAVLAFEREAGITLRHIPFPGAADLRAAALGGHITLASMNISETVDDLEAGNLRVLGQMSKERWALAAEVPTFAEQGYNVIMGSHRGIGVPAGVPDDIFTKLAEAVQKAVEDPEFQSMSQKQKVPVEYQGAASFGGQLNEINATLQQMWNEQPWSQKK